MKILQLLSKNRKNLSLNSTTKEDVINELCSIMDDGKTLNDVNIYRQAIKDREEIMCTVIVPEIAMPHAKSASVNNVALTLGISKQGIDYGGDTGLTYLFFIIAAPDNSEDAYLSALASLAKLLINESFKKELLAADTSDEIFEIVKKFETQTEDKPKILNTDI